MTNMVNYVEWDTITLADLINGFNRTVFNAVDNYLNLKLPTMNCINQAIEKPLNTEEACEFLQMSEPVLRELAESGDIPRHQFKGRRGYYYFASELVQALKGQKSIS